MSRKTTVLIVTSLFVLAIAGAAMVRLGMRRPAAEQIASATETVPSSRATPGPGSPTPTPFPDIRAAGREAVGSLVQLVVPSDLGASSHTRGSGSIVDGERGLILTNWHLVTVSPGILSNDDGYAKVYMTDGLDQFPQLTYWARLLTEYSDPELDLALLQITHRASDLAPVQRPLDLRAVPLRGPEPVHTGDAILLLGFPDYAGGRVSWSEGYVVAHDSWWIKSDAEISHGHSGGMFLNRFGELVGVPTEYEDTSVGSEIGLARPVDLARPLIEEALAADPIPSQTLRRRPSVTDTLKVVLGTPYLDLRLEGGLALVDAQIERGTLLEVLRDPKWEYDTLWYYVQMVGTRLAGWVDGSYLASWETANAPIVFASDRAGSFDLYRMLPDGTGMARLTQDPGDEGFPSWSPDREAIVFAASRDDNLDLYTMTLDDRTWNRLTEDAADDMYPAWSPDGSRIAFASDRDGDWEIFVADVDGSGLQQVTFNDVRDVAPTWSPDGTRLVYTSRRAGDDDLYLFDAIPETEQRLTTNPYADAHPSWSPEGDEIAYVAVVPDGGADARELHVLNVNQPEEPSVITRLEPSELSDGYVDWSPDGRWIVFTTERDGNTEIYLAPADGAWTANVTEAELANDSTPAWAR